MDNIILNAQKNNLDNKKTENIQNKKQTILSKISNIENNENNMNFNKKYFEFNINNNSLNEKYEYKNNYISTTKYNFITFIPKSFFLQFKRLANVYFLIIAIIQSIPLISPLSGATAIIPLLFVILISMIRELIEDIQRYKYDKINNEEEVIVYRENNFIKNKSETLEVGEIILIKNNAQIPCDCIFLFSSFEEGICYLETSSLDGEKTLKEKEGNKIITSKLKEIGFILNYEKYNLFNYNISGFCQCDFPNPDFHNFDGKIKLNINNIDINQNYLPLTNHQILYKGAILKNTEWVLGIVLYTGMKNKIILNSEKPRMKLSQIEKRMSKYLIWVFIVQVFLCIFCAIMNKISYIKHKNFYKLFIIYSNNASLESFISFFTFILLLNTLIPISLIVSLEIVKVIQGFFINWDVGLYSFKYKKFCFAKSVSINEELGNVNYIFTDKTGTLTCNKMEFKYCLIGETCYQYNEKDDNGIVQNEEFPFQNTESVKVYGKNKKIIYTSHLNNINNLTNTNHNYKTVIPNKIIRTKFKQIGKHYFDSLINHQKENKKIQNEIELIKEFWTAICCAHECICSERENGIEYTGISPDDIELVKAASNQGFCFLKSNNNIRKISICSEEKNFIILKILNFTSERKRMSIIIKDDKNNIKLYCKGADTEIRKRIVNNNNNENSKYIHIISKNVDRFSSRGYRTLMVAMKIIPENEYNIWKKKLDKSEINLNNKSNLINKCYEEIETNLTLIGATVVEDKLQDKVPETIRDLRLAGIKIWVLTGDKIDTAENIALSCNLISSNYKNFKIKSLNKKNKKENNQEIDLFFNEFQEFSNEEIKNIKINDEYILESNNNYENTNKENILKNKNENEKEKDSNTITPYSILIESSILSIIMSDKEKTEKFLKIALCASTVICCRVSPLQKSQVVKMVKKYNKDVITLAIGDGGNDVSMIMEAHIGIGLYGNEGLRAVQASDFSIGEFKFLRRLLLFHGRINLHRIRRMILYFFYKNFVFTICQFFYAFESLFSGQTIIDDWFIACYNLLFTSVPLVVQACTDFNIKDDDSELICEMMPFIYKENYQRRPFNHITFSCILIKGGMLSFLNYIFVIYSIKESVFGNDGYEENLWSNSYVLYTNIIGSVSITLLIFTFNIIWILPLTIFITTFVLYFGFCLFENYEVSFNSYGTLENCIIHLKFYLIILLFCSIVFIVDYCMNSCYVIFSNSITSFLKIYEMGKKNKKVNLPKIILDAKMDIEIINKYNNYNMIKNNSENFSLSKLIQFHFEEKLITYRKSRTYVVENDRYKNLKKLGSQNLNNKLKLNSSIKKNDNKIYLDDEDNSANIVNL